MEKIEGSCRCGAVGYVLSAEPVATVNCHCSLCRGMSGAAFSSYVVARRSDVLFRGEASLSRYDVTERSTKHFCGTCGTPVFNTNPATYPGLVMLYLGTLLTPGHVAPAINLFCDSKLPWVDSVGSLRSFPQAVPR